MADTAIEWASKVWNPVVGCSLQSPGCTNCYAMRMAWRLQNMAARPDGTGNPAMNHYEGTVQQSKGGPVWTGLVNVAPDDVFLSPMRRKKPTDYFVNSMSDLFHPAVPVDVIDRVFAVMALAQQHIFKVLTKRSDRMRDYWADRATRERIIRTAEAIRPATAWSADVWQATTNLALNVPLPNIWLGVSVEDQRRWDERVEDLENTPAAVRFVSIEPLLGPIKTNLVPRFIADSIAPMTPEIVNAIHGQVQRPFEIRSMTVHYLDWVIVGGESGPDARPMHPDWARALRDQCAAAGVPFLFKQWGEWLPIGQEDAAVFPLNRAQPFRDEHRFENGEITQRVGKKVAGRLLDGVEHNGMLEVRHG